MRDFKLDRRYNGYSMFKYAVEFPNVEMGKFCEVREWFWENFGSSREYDKWHLGAQCKNPRWAWDCDEFKNRIYVGTEKEYSMFLLKFK